MIYSLIVWRIVFPSSVEGSHVPLLNIKCPSLCGWKCLLCRDASLTLLHPIGWCSGALQRRSPSVLSLSARAPGGSRRPGGGGNYTRHRSGFLGCWKRQPQPGHHVHPAGEDPILHRLAGGQNRYRALGDTRSKRSSSTALDAGKRNSELHSILSTALLFWACVLCLKFFGFGFFPFPKLNFKAF